MLDKGACARCGNKYIFEELIYIPEGGASICPPCAEELNPARESKRHCPVDGVEMMKLVVYARVLIDKCASCGGIWVDGNEIEVMRKATVQASPEMEKMFWLA